jgi:hypothetical protein
MLQRRAPVLALLLAVCLVAYPVTMPLAMAAEMPGSMPMSMAGGGQGAHPHQPAHQHHGLTTCCAGVCGACPVISIAAGTSPQVRASTAVVTFRQVVPSTTDQSASRRLPYAIGPPRATSRA